jgi:hypothetical protein
MGLQISGEDLQALSTLEPADAVAVFLLKFHTGKSFSARVLIQTNWHAAETLVD